MAFASRAAASCGARKPRLGSEHSCARTNCRQQFMAGIPLRLTLHHPHAALPRSTAGRVLHAPPVQVFPLRQVSRALQWLAMRPRLVGSMLRAMHEKATGCLAAASRRHALRVHMRIIPPPRQAVPACPCASRQVCELTPNSPGYLSILPAGSTCLSRCSMATSLRPTPPSTSSHQVRSWHGGCCRCRCCGRRRCCLLV